MTKPSASPKLSTKANWNIPRLVLALSGVILAVLVMLAVRNISDTSDRLVEAEAAKLTALADIREAQIEAITEGYRQKGSLVASRTRLRQLMADYSSVADPSTSAGMSKILRDAASSDPLIMSASTVSLDGLIVGSSDDALIGLDIAAVDQTWTGHADPSSDGELRLSVGEGVVTLAAAAPMSLDGEHQGTALLKLADDASNPLLSTAQFGRSGEVIVGFAHGPSGTTFLTPLRRSVASGFVPAEDASLPMVAASDGEEGVLDGSVDYAGVSAIAVTRHLDELDWGLVAKVDTAEVAGQVTPIRDGFLILGVGLILFGVTAGLMYGRRLADEAVALNRAEARFNSMFTSAPIALLLVDEQGIIQLANHTVSKLLGYGESELAGLPVDSLVPTSVRGHHAQLRSQFLADAKPRAMRLGQDVVAVAADGREVPVEIGLTPIETDDGMMVVAAIIDLSERKAAERLLEDRANELERSNRDLDAFAYVASHDLKAPLRAIETLADFVIEDAGELLPDDARKDLKEIQHRSNALTELLNGLLQYARIGREESEPVAIDVAEMVEGISELYVPSDRFEVSVGRDFPTLIGPRPAAELIFRNLIMNAINHHDRESGSISINGRIDGDRVWITVEDDGPGIPADQRERVFQMFKTAGHKEGAGSSGMGLTLIRRTIETHGGSIQIADRVGRGTIFELRWPNQTLGALRNSDAEPVAAESVANKEHMHAIH